MRVRVIRVIRVMRVRVMSRVMRAGLTFGHDLCIGDLHGLFKIWLGSSSVSHNL